MNKEKLIEKIRELKSKQPWNHSVELLPGVFTCSPEQISAGKNLIKWERMKGFLESFSCKNKRMLDVGCNDGFFSLKLAELGANVVAFEASPERVEKAKFVFELRKVSNKIELIRANIYEYPLESLGYFDLVLCMGFIHRVPDPFALLSKLVPLSDSFLLEFKAFPEYAHDRPYLMFDGRRSDPEDPYTTCYFVPSVRAVVKMIRELDVEYYGIIGNPKSQRVMIITSKNNLPVLQKLSSLNKVSIFYLLAKFTKRYGADVLKSLRGDFGKK